VSLSTLAQSLGGRSGARLKHNARALAQYWKHWGGDAHLTILKDLSLSVSSSAVRVSVVPDLHVASSPGEGLIKLEFSSEALKPDLAKIMCQLMLEASMQANLPIKPAHIQVVEVSQGTTHKAARVGSRLRGEIEAACANIAALWDTL
jgi:hypothetical protein